MKNTFVVAALLTIAVLAVGSANADILNPYAPMNAVTAEPMDPYNLWLIPQCSRTSYEPCPTCYFPYSWGLPDVPIQWMVRGCLGIPVPVP